MTEPPPEQDPPTRLARRLSAAGLVGCVVVALSLPRASVVGGVVVIPVGALGWAARQVLAR